MIKIGKFLNILEKTNSGKLSSDTCNFSFGDIVTGDQKFKAHLSYICKFKTSLRYKILSQKYKQTGAGEMAGWLKALATLTKDWRSSPSTHTGQLTLPVTLGECDLTLSSVL